MPVVPPEACRVEITWQLENLQEIAVNSIWLQHVHQTGNTFDWANDLPTVANKVATAIQNDSGGGAKVTDYMETGTRLGKVTAYGIGTDGKAFAKAEHLVTPGTVVGTESGGPLPPTFCAVLQLLGYSGYVQHKRRHTGRLFLPASSDTVIDGATGLLSRDATGGIAAAWAAVLNDIQGMHVGSDASGIALGGSSDHMNVVVYSRHDGAFYQLEGVQVANKPGWQRRRMNKIARIYGTPATIAHS